MHENLESFLWDEVILNFDGRQELFSLVDFFLDFVFQDLDELVSILFHFEVAVVVDADFLRYFSRFLHLPHFLLTSHFPLFELLI